MTPEEERIYAQDAEHVLNNKAFKFAIEKVREGLNRRELSCNTAKEPETAADIVRCKQLMAGLERELYKLISGGEVVNFQLKELDKKKRPFFNRGY